MYAKAVVTGEKLLSQKMQKQRLTWVTLPQHGNEKIRFGIGSDQGWLGHTGELPDYNVGMYYLPTNDATMVVMVPAFLTMTWVLCQHCCDHL